MGNENEETGQYYYRARMYSPVQSRFISRDPMGMVDGPNMYAYVQNDPVNARDPSGCFANPMGPPPNTFNGAGGGGGGAGYDLTECPLDPVYWDYASCVEGFIDAGYSVNEATSYCIDVCYESGWHGAAGFDYSTFWECMFPTRGSWDTILLYAMYTGCVATIISSIASGGLTAPAIAKACGTTAATVHYCYTISV